MKGKRNRLIGRKHSPEEQRANRDPITGARGAHPVGSGVGAAEGGAIGAAIGAVAGPAGAAVGAAIGGVAGGLLGKGVAEGINPTQEHAYWRENYTNRPYVEENVDYSTYAPAYQYGWESWSAYRAGGRSFDDVEAELRRSWESNRGESDLPWSQACDACRDAWERCEASGPDKAA